MSENSTATTSMPNPSSSMFTDAGPTTSTMLTPTSYASAVTPSFLKLFEQPSTTSNISSVSPSSLSDQPTGNFNSSFPSPTTTSSTKFITQVASEQYHPEEGTSYAVDDDLSGDTTPDVEQGDGDNLSPQDPGSFDDLWVETDETDYDDSGDGNDSYLQDGTIVDDSYVPAPQPVLTSALFAATSADLTSMRPEVTYSSYKSLPASPIPTQDVNQDATNSSSNYLLPAEKAAVAVCSILAVAALITIVVFYGKIRRHHRARKAVALPSPIASLIVFPENDGEKPPSFKQDFTFPCKVDPVVIGDDEESKISSDSSKSSQYFVPRSRFSVTSSDCSASDRSSTTSSQQAAPGFVSFFSSIMPRHPLHPAPLLTPQEFFTLPTEGDATAAATPLPFRRMGQHLQCYPIMEEEEMPSTPLTRAERMV